MLRSRPGLEPAARGAVTGKRAEVSPQVRQSQTFAYRNRDAANLLRGHPASDLDGENGGLGLEGCEQKNGASTLNDSPLDDNRNN